LPAFGAGLSEARTPPYGASRFTSAIPSAVTQNFRNSYLPILTFSQFFIAWPPPVYSSTVGFGRFARRFPADERTQAFTGRCVKRPCGQGNAGFPVSPGRRRRP